MRITAWAKSESVSTELVLLRLPGECWARTVRLSSGPQAPWPVAMTPSHVLPVASHFMQRWLGWPRPPRAACEGARGPQRRGPRLRNEPHPCCILASLGQSGGLSRPHISHKLNGNANDIFMNCVFKMLKYLLGKHFLNFKELFKCSLSRSLDERGGLAVLISRSVAIALKLVTEWYQNGISLYLLIGLIDVTQKRDLWSLSTCSLGPSCYHEAPLKSSSLSVLICTTFVSSITTRENAHDAEKSAFGTILSGLEEIIPAFRAGNDNNMVHF